MAAMPARSRLRAAMFGRRPAAIKDFRRALEDKLANAQVIDTSNLSTEKVVFGVTVTIMDLQTDEEKKYTLVGQDEADLKDGKISVQSPVGKALIGKRVGDSVSIVTPSKTVEYEILKITFE